MGRTKLWIASVMNSQATRLCILQVCTVEKMRSKKSILRLECVQYDNLRLIT